MPAISVKNIFKSFGEKLVLRGISLEVEEGSIHGLLGHNGAGKTTLIRIILGLLNPSSGHVEVFSKEPRFEPEIKAEIGYVSEYLGLYSSMTVEDNLVRFARLRGVQSPEEVARRAIEEFDLQEYAKYKVKKLSAGTKQRVAIARAMINHPRLLILDEFLSNIDPEWRHKLKDTLKSLKEQGVTIFMSTHILSDVEDLCDHVTIIREGELLYSGSLDNLYRETKIGVPSVKVSTSNNERAYELFARLYDDVRRATDGSIIVRIEGEKDVSQITKLCVENGLDVYEVVRLKPSLETIYLSLYRGKEHE